jgi:hypothetical protein
MPAVDADSGGCAMTTSYPTPTTSPWCVFSFDKCDDGGLGEVGKAVSFTGMLHVSWSIGRGRYEVRFQLSGNEIDVRRAFATRLEVYRHLEAMGVPVRHLHPSIPGLLDPIGTETRFWIRDKEVSLEAYREWYEKGCP